MSDDPVDEALLRAPDHSSDLPRLHRDMIRRPRLLDVMASRFDRVATVISAGAGFGKSTLLAQAIHDPVSAARATVVFHRISPNDHDASALTASLSAQIRRAATRGTPDVDTGGDPAAAGTTDVSIADQLWHLSPTRISVFIDDYHHLPGDASGWSELDDLVANLPDNADVTFAGRGDHHLKLARLVARGEVVELDEDDLAFMADELDDFARLRSVDRDQLDDHGWPALVELEAQAGVAGAHDFVAEEVLAQLDDERVGALRRLAVHDEIDDELFRRLTDVDVTLDALLDGLPLTSSDGRGHWTMHDIWRDVLVAGLRADERREVGVEVARILRSRGDLRGALAAALRVDDAEDALDTLAEFARDLPLRHSIEDRRAVISTLPASLSSTAEAELLRADIAYATEPTLAAEPIQRAIDVATEQNRPEVTVLALLRLGDLSYRSGDRAGVVDARTRLARLAELGGTGADAALALTRSWLLLLDNSADEAIETMSSPALTRYPPVASMVDYYRAVQLGHAGRCDASLEVLDDLRRSASAPLERRMGGFGGLMAWWAGRLDAAGRAASLALTEQIGVDRQVHLYVEAMATAALYHASAGEVATARTLLDRAVAHRSRIPEQAWGGIAIEIATAVIDLMEGDEAAAAVRLDRVLPATGPFDGFARHVFGNGGAVIYALVPRSREFFDRESTGPDLALATRVGQALVALRDAGSAEAAARLPWDEIRRLRTWAYEPHLAELAIGAMSTGATRPREALTALVHDPRGALHAIADRHDDPIGTLAATELAATPRRPTEVVHLDVLGPTTVRFGDQSIDDAAPIKRKMVRELLLLLVDRRVVRREEAAAIIWPDKDEAGARNNLRATLAHLRRLLETDDDDAPPWHVRADGETIELFTSDRLRIDADDFASEIAAARRSDRERRAADALEHHRRALELYRGPYLDDALDPDWAFNARTTFHLDLVEAATRASELSAGHGAFDDAIAFARRAVAAEELSERAHRALIRGLAASGDRAGALRAVERVTTILADNGLTPADDTRRLGVELKS